MADYARLRMALHQAVDLVVDALADEPATKPERKPRALKIKDVKIDEFTMARAIEAGRKAGLL